MQVLIFAKVSQIKPSDCHKPTFDIWMCELYYDVYITPVIPCRRQLLLRQLSSCHFARRVSIGLAKPHNSETVSETQNYSGKC